MTSQRQNPPTQKLWKSLQTRASLPVLTEQAGAEFPAGASDPLAVPPLTAGLSRRRFLFPGRCVGRLCRRRLLPAP